MRVMGPFLGRAENWNEMGKQESRAPSSACTGDGPPSVPPASLDSSSTHEKRSFSTSTRYALPTATAVVGIRRMYGVMLLSKFEVASFVSLAFSRLAYARSAAPSGVVLYVWRAPGRGG